MPHPAQSQTSGFTPVPRRLDGRNSIYSVTFVATDGISNANTLGPNGAAILFTLNNGATFNYAGGGSPTVTDDTNPADSPGGCSSLIMTPYIFGIEGGDGDCVNPDGLDIPAGNTVTVTTRGIVNPPGPSQNETLTVSTNNDPNPVASAPYAIVPEGYWLVGSDGGAFTFGEANFYGSTGHLRLQRPVVGIVSTATHGGYWLDASDGGVFSFGDTQFYGSIPGLGIHPAGSDFARRLSAPIVGMVPSFNDRGYFMVGADGGVFAFGDAKFAGSCPGIGGCEGVAVAVMPDASGNGYWLVTNVGRVYAFGDARYLGAPGNRGSSVTSAVRTPDGEGYWILFSNGNAANYGDAVNLGPALLEGDSNDPATAIFSAYDSDGASVAYSDGTVVSYGDAPNYGGMEGTNLNGSIIAASGY